MRDEGATRAVAVGLRAYGERVCERAVARQNKSPSSRVRSLLRRCADARLPLLKLGVGMQELRPGAGELIRVWGFYSLSEGPSTGVQKNSRSTI